jgi:DNA-binding transcriptional ArsR family regulator
MVNDIICEKYHGWQKQMVKILSAIRFDGLQKVALACKLALESNTVTESTVINHLMRLRDEPLVDTIEPPDTLKLSAPVVADLTDYDNYY